MVSSTLILALVIQNQKVDHGIGSTDAGQSIADAIRIELATDFAFVPAGMLIESATGSIVSTITDPEETITAVTLKGHQVKAALTRSVSMYPKSNPGFLQVSGLEIIVKSTLSGNLITDIQGESGGVDEKETYTVAMPISLFKGAFGYFTIWNDKTPAKHSAKTLQTILLNKNLSPSNSRWQFIK